MAARREILRWCAALFGGIAMGGPAHAQQPGEHLVLGFRSAGFGMREAEVRAAIARDFPAAAEAVTRAENSAEHTTALVVRLAALEPGPGPAQVSYVFGASSQRLVGVHVTWTSQASPSDGERDRYAVAGSQLAEYFRSLRWGPRVAVAPSPAGKNGLVLFAGVDGLGAGVELRVLGIGIVSPEGQAGPDARGPAQLRVGYFANVARADVRTGALHRPRRVA